MKLILNPLIIAFSTYSRIPMPEAKWNDQNMRYSMCFFPLVGAVVGLCMLTWLWLCARLQLGGLMMGTVGCAIPLLISGGIHMDGFMDTIDAVASHQPRERKLIILKDTHTGAFAVIGCATYLLLMAGALSEAELSVIPIGFVLSRALSALALVTFKCASTGLLKAFSDSAQKRAVRRTMIGVLAVFGTLSVLVSPVQGLCGLIACIACYFHYHRLAMTQFGGTTGDLAGYFLQLCELSYVFAVVISGRLA